MSSGETSPYTGPSGALKADSDWLGFEDMPVGRNVTLTIKTALILDGVPMQQGHKYSGGGLEFVEGKKNKMLLNSGNRKILNGLFTTDTAKWIDQKISIYGDPTVKFGNTVTGGIRIRDKAADTMRQRADELAGGTPGPEPSGAGAEPSTPFQLDGAGPERCDGEWGETDNDAPESCGLDNGHAGECGPKDE